MLIASASNNQTIAPTSSVKLRRSRRLSSTRGLKQRTTANIPKDSLPCQDPHRKLGLCAALSENIDEDNTRGRLLINWEMNERISLSSGSSVGLAIRPDSRKGIEFSENRRREIESRSKIVECSERNREAKSSSSTKPTLELMNVSGFPSNVDRKHRGSSRSIEIDTADENVLKSDSKYEIGTPSNRGSATRKQRQQNTLRKDNVDTTRRWTKDKSGDSISKRLELIHELNQKILANYERFQQRSKRAKDTKEQTVKNCAKDSVDPEEHVYTEIKRRNKTTCGTRDRKNQGIFKQDISNQETCRKESSKRDTCRQADNKSVLSKSYYESIKGRTEKRDISRATNKPDRRIVCENMNFSMAAKENFFYQADEKTLQPSKYVKLKNKKGRLSEGSSVFYANEDDVPPKESESIETRDCLENSRLYPESCNLYNNEPENDSSKEDNAKDNALKIDRSDSRGDAESRTGSEDDVTDEKILESKILENLDETIDRFDSERTQLTSGDSNEEKDSFSTDSIQSGSPSSVKDSKDAANLLDTFNSSWDSGVGVDVGNGSGWVRIHTGIESSLVYLTLDTTAKDVCRDMLLGDDLSLFVQYGGEPGRRLASQEKPLEIQDQFLQRLGYQDISRRARLGVDPELRHLIGFHVGPASPLPDLAGYSRCGYTLVLKGLVFPQWKRRPLAIIGSRLFLYPACPESRAEWMELGGGGGAVCYAPSRLGKLVLRVTGFPRVTQQCHVSQHPEESHHRETRHLYLGFHHPWDRDLWKSWIKKATQLSTCPKSLDLSKAGLSRLPDSAIAFAAIEELALGCNQFTNVDNNLKLLHRFPKLHAVHLESNNLHRIPRELLELSALTYLNLSDNKIEIIPADICRLINLKELILDRNAIKDLPDEVTRLRNLRNISLVGNLLNTVPSFFNMRALTLTEVLSKTDHGKSYKDEKVNHSNLHKINLRNNQLKGNIILGNYGNLTHLDVSENSIEKLDISALQELRSVRCGRNNLTELTLCGRNLVSLIAGNNRLKKLIVEPVPINLEHLDVSYNNLDALPEWTTELPALRVLFASHNALTALPDRLLSQPSRLEVLHLPHNRLQALPPPRRPLNIVHLTLQGNMLTTLPTSFFANTEKMKVLNLSNNRLSELPYREEAGKIHQGSHTLEKLYVTANCLTDTALDALAKFTSLRILHIAYNTLDTLPESCIAAWGDLEELVLSGNRLQYLPDNVANLRHLRVLRVHSNRLLTCPTFSRTTSLKVLDLAHNQLDRVNLATLVPPQLQFLDISCNSRLHVDPRQFQDYRSQRPISLVDVSGQNRPSLPSHPHQQEIVAAEKNTEQPWRLGFSETAGSREKLYISQVRMPSFCNIEGLFGIFDGGSNQEAPSALQEMIPRLLLEERTVRETSKEYLKYTLLSAHRELKEKGQKYGVDATLVHVVKLPSQQGYPKSSTKYSLKVASTGDAKAVLCRAAGPLTFAKSKKSQTVKNQLGNAAMFPLAVPDPIYEEVALEDDDEFVIVANRKLWEVLSVQEAVREARAEASPVLAAKRLQDLAQAYGAEDNLSIIVVRMAGPSPGDMDQLMRELRHAVGKNRSQGDSVCPCPCCVPPATHKPPAACCCHANEGYYLNGVLKNIVSRSNKVHGGSGRYFKNSRSTQENESPPYRDDRSSPSGQSDQASDSTFKSRHPSGRMWSGSAAARATNKAHQSVLMQENSMRKVSSCLSTQEDAISERSSALSEEQFRCWEYMLEQNTQLLFDKELDTLTKAPLHRGQSRSTPQLGSNLPFLSKRFGSARSFNPSLPRPPMVRFGSGRRMLNGGPNAAYFGSLQRLMPYNLEYDFAVIQERNGMDSLEQDATRMQQYWGVATTEL
ncbi:PREDICTED: PH domain leucine-rich repeat-containing protein phosphatase 2 [Wasmannia auropunctata]|uniref:PH domain leucine-rich repeat-containing protein phosphatase 2 n=1 Tax=Wasmannia auropunctata TaxID=64793 RepID=UPI0005EE58C1|nr:PREDICTED: PH domain leucine-rich repeat-containing protein phosphatase 2 [Wasmannia auropunctata]